MKCHEVDYEIFGDDLQIVEVELDPGETVIAEAGAMNYMEDGITFEAKMGEGMAFIHAGGRQKGEGSLLGGLGNLIDGDNW